MLANNSIELKDVSIVCNPSMMNLTSFQDRLNNFSYTFNMSKVYAVVSEPGKGGWALSYLLSGKSKGFKGCIIIDGQPTDQHNFQLHGWYVGEGISKRNVLGFRKEITVREQLESAVNSKYTVNKWIELFDLTPDRLERELKYISNERWNASTAIGLAHQKRIFCFPWFDDSIINIIRERLRLCGEIIRRNNGIMIIPVKSASIVEEFADEVIYMR